MVNLTCMEWPTYLKYHKPFSVSTLLLSWCSSSTLLAVGFGIATFGICADHATQDWSHATNDMGPHLIIQLLFIYLHNERRNYTTLIYLHNERRNLKPGVLLFIHGLFNFVFCISFFLFGCCCWCLSDNIANHNARNICCIKPVISCHGDCTRCCDGARHKWIPEFLNLIPEFPGIPKWWN